MQVLKILKIQESMAGLNIIKGHAGIIIIKFSLKGMDAVLSFDFVCVILGFFGKFLHIDFV